MSGPNLTPGSPQRTTASADAVMKGHGFYNEHSRPQQTADSLGLPLLGRAIEERTVPQGQSLQRLQTLGPRRGPTPWSDAPRRTKDTTADDGIHPDSGYPH